ncbi:hypothetical protein Tco_0593904 [Tanacetum coccineum]
MCVWFSPPKGSLLTSEVTLELGTRGEEYGEEELRDRTTINHHWLALGWHLEEIHVTWAHFGKKRTRLQLYTKFDEEKPYNDWRRRHRTLLWRLEVKETASGFLDMASKVSDLKKP